MKIIARNRRARYDYTISNTLIGGLVLLGAEAKSAKLGHLSLKGSYANFMGGELYLINAHISPYKYAGETAFEPTRKRKILIHKEEIAEIIGKKQQGLAIVPLAVGIDHSLVKIELGIGRGKKAFDKRMVIKKREANRDIARAQQAANRTHGKS